MRDRTMSNLMSENLLSLSQAAARIPPYRGKRTNPSTIYRWITKGVRRPDGSVIRLESIRIAARRLTTIEAMERFALSCSADSLDKQPSPCNQRTPGQRRRASERAAQDLKKLGV